MRHFRRKWIDSQIMRQKLKNENSNLLLSVLSCLCFVSYVRMQNVTSAGLNHATSLTLPHFPLVSVMKQRQAVQGPFPQSYIALSLPLSGKVWEGGGWARPLPSPHAQDFCVFQNKINNHVDFFFFSSQKVYLTIQHSFFHWIKAVFYKFELKKS